MHAPNPPKPRLPALITALGRTAAERAALDTGREPGTITDGQLNERLAALEAQLELRGATKPVGGPTTSKPITPPATKRFAPDTETGSTPSHTSHLAGSSMSSASVPPSPIGVTYGIESSIERFTSEPTFKSPATPPISLDRRLPVVTSPDEQPGSPPGGASRKTSGSWPVFPVKLWTPSLAEPPSASPSRLSHQHSR